MGAAIETKLHDDRFGVVGTIEDTGDEGAGRFLARLVWRRKEASRHIQEVFDSADEAGRWLEWVYEEWLYEEWVGSDENRAGSALW